MARTTMIVDTGVRDKTEQYHVKGEASRDIIVKLIEVLRLGQKGPF